MSDGLALDHATIARQLGRRERVQRLGLAASDTSPTMERGTAREPEVLSAWIERLERGDWTHEAERAIDPSTVVIPAAGVT